MMKAFFTKRANKSFSNIKDYLIEEWSESVALAFEQRTIDFLDLIERFPEMGVVEIAQKNLRSYLLTKQVRVFYRIKGNQVIILTFFDTRKNPKKRPK
jgi:plasmid stabilization system protein ParE